MSNPQQPELRRSGRDPAVADSAGPRAGERPALRGGRQQKDTRPAEQRTSYGPERDEAEERGHGPSRTGPAPTSRTEPGDIGQE